MNHSVRVRILYILFIVPLCVARLVSASIFDHVTSDERHDMIRRAQIWHPISVSSADTFSGPGGDGAFQFDQTVHCSYVEKRRHGTSPKFFCRLESGDIVKVRYGRENNEVYGQVVASRLLWALGFGANANYPVRVVCEGCSVDPWNNPEPVSQSVTFSPATIERKVKGEEIDEQGKTDQGWGWHELERVDEKQNGATRAQIDALKLLGVFMAHVDSRPGNQRFVCLEDGVDQSDSQVSCEKPFMYISDVGTTFGGAHEQAGFSTLKLRYWKKWPIWKDPTQCIADLAPEEQRHGMLRSPKISEAGRQFLADLLIQLSDEQILDLFRGARAEQVDQHPGYVALDDWVEAFKQRRRQIVEHRCLD